MFKIWKQEGKF